MTKHFLFYKFDTKFSPQNVWLIFVLWKKDYFEKILFLKKYFGPNWPNGPQLDQFWTHLTILEPDLTFENLLFFL